ncbi:YSIRK-type signal peptide-containing protein, partial [Streptococcus mitis]
MENKSNSLSRIKRQQREKVLRYSIRKYSFGAASVAVAALMFLGARVASADSVLPNAPQSNTANAGVVNPKDKVDSPVDVTESTDNKVDEGNKSPENQALTNAAPSASTVDKAKLKKVVEELNALLSTKLNLDESVVSPVKDRLQKGKEALESSELAQKDIDELVELLSKDVTVVSAAKEVTEVQVDKQADKTEKPADNLASQTSPEVRASEESQTVSAKKDALKVSVDQLQAAVLELPEHETSKEVLEKANELLGLAQGVLENTTVSLNDVEDMTKRVKRMFNSVKNATTRLNSGARDSRNSHRMAQGTSFRANGEINQGALANIKYFASVDPKDNGGRNTRNDDPEFTKNKTDIKATYVQDSEGKWIVYDVFFNNDGQRMTKNSYQQQYYFQAPFNIMHSSNTVRDLSFTRYRNDGGRRLSDGFTGFTQYGNTANISNVWGQNYNIFNNDRRTIYDPSSGVTRDNQRWDVFKNNQNDPTLNTLTKNKNGGYPGASYYLGIKTGAESSDYAVHMHAKIRLRDDVTAEEAAQYGRVYAASTTYGKTTNQSYIMGATGTRLQSDPEAPKDPIQGLTVTKTVGDNAGDPINPVSSGYVRHKNGGTFPAGMNWTWKDNKSPSTAEAGVFKYKSIATYKDNSSSEDKNSGSDGTVTLKVKPKQPTIATSVEHKKGLPNQQITVNVGSGVPNGSTVKLYDGNTVIGTGTTNGQTATVTVVGALPGNPIKAETTVNNGGVVTSEKSNPVTPTEAPDTQRPTLTITPSTRNVVEGQQISFTVTATDDKNVNLDAKDFLTKYLNRIFAGEVSTTREINEVNKKVDRITITTKAEDLGKTNTITFNATDNAGNKADPATFTFTVTPRDNQKPIVEVGGIRLTENEPQSAQFYVYRGATFNPTVKAWDDSGNITSMSVENLPKGSQAQTYTAQTGKDGSSDAKKYTTSLSTGTVADTQTLGDHVAKFKISDGVNNATYLMKYKVVDVVVENSPKTVELNSMSGNPNNYLNTAGAQNNLGQPTVGSQADVYFPGGMNFRWDRADGSTDVQLSRVGQQTHKAIAVFPNSPGTRDGAQVYAPATAERNVVFNVVDNEKPKATLNGVTLSETANEPIFTVYRGATFNPELKVSDNSGVISKVEVKGGLPNGVTPSTFTAQTGKTEATPYAERLSSGTVLNTETLGVHESTLHVEGSSPSDSRDFKFKYRVVDIETKNLDENGIAKVPVASTLNKANSSKNIDAHNYLKVVDSQDKADRGNNYLPSGMTWTWKDRNGNNLDPGTTLDNSGKYTRTATAIFPDASKNSITDATSTTRTTFAPAEIKRQVILAVTPTAPSVEGKENGSVTITPPTRPDSTNPQDIDTITLTYVPTGKTSPETVTVTKSGNNWTVNGKTADKVSVTPEGVVTISADEVADKTEVTAKVSKNIDNVVLESPVARGTANGPLAAEVTNPAPVTEKAPITPVTVVTPNKPGSRITVDGPVNGLTVDDEGKLKGTPKVDNWEPKEEERIVEIPVKVTNGGETVTVKVPVPIQRDTDGDGIPDKEDSDDDNDGIPDTQDKNPKVADKLTGTVTGKTVPEKAPVPANTKVVTPNKPGTTITVDGPVNGLTVDNGGNLVGTPTVDNWEPKEEERTVEIPVKLKKGTEEVVVKVPVKIQRDTDGDGIPDVKDPDDDNDGIPDTEDANPKVADKLTGTVTGKTVPEKAPVPANTKVVTPNKPGTTITVDGPVNGLTVDNGGNLVGTPTVDNWEPKEEERTVEIPVKLKKGKEEVVVKVPVKIQRDTDGDGIPDVKDPDDDNDGIPDTEDANPKVADKLTGTVTGKTVPEKTPVPANTKVITPNKPGTTITVDNPVNGLTVDNGGNLVGTPTVTDWGPKEEERTVEIPVKLKKGTEEVVVKVPVTIERDTDGDGTPDKVDSDDDNDGIPDEEEITNGTDPKTPTTQTPTIEITRKPNGNAVVTPKKPDGSTYPSGSKVVIPGENNTPITVTIGDNGSGEVPNDKLPKKDVPGTGTVTEPNKKPSQPVDVTTPARKTPTVDVEQDPKTGDVTVTPKKPDGSTFPPGTTVEIPGKDGKLIPVTIGENGKGKVPNSDLPDGKVPGTGKITEPGKPAVEVPVTTPGKVTPATPTTETPSEIEITRKPNGDAVVTPKKPDGSTYPSGSKVVIPGENNTPITVTIGDNGSGEVPNDKLPKKDVPGKGTVTEPNKKPSQPVDVTTPARKTPTVDVEQDPKT